MRLGVRMSIAVGIVVVNLDSARWAPVVLATQAPQAAPAGDKNCGDAPQASPLQPVPRSEENTFVFNHHDLTAEGNQPYVLKVDEGGYFQVIFKCTAPALFTYTISGDAALQPDSASGATLPESIQVADPLSTRGVTMRHDARFLRYHVTAKLRDGLQQPATAGKGSAAPAPPPDTSKTVPPNKLTGVSPLPAPPAADETPAVRLYSVAFDVWVITKPDWRLSVIGGIGVSSLTDTKYFIKTDDKNNTTFEKTPDEGQDSLHTDVTALANVYYSRVYQRFLNAGVAFGIGSSGTTPRFFVGPSIIFGKYFVFTGGMAIGSVAAPPVGQEMGRRPVNGENTLNSLSSRVTARSFFGIGFTWIDRRDQFAAALSSAASASGVVGSCVTSVKPDAVTFDASGVASADVTVEAAEECFWIATLQNGGTQVALAPGSKKGKATIKLKGEKAGGSAWSDTLNVAGPMGSAPRTVKLTQAPAKP